MPRFSLRALLTLVSLGALLSFAVARALAGVPWALAAVVLVGSCLLVVIVQTCVFGAAWLLGLVLPTLRKPQRPKLPLVALLAASLAGVARCEEPPTRTGNWWGTRPLQWDCWDAPAGFPGYMPLTVRLTNLGAPGPAREVGLELWQCGNARFSKLRLRQPVRLEPPPTSKVGQVPAIPPTATLSLSVPIQCVEMPNVHVFESGRQLAMGMTTSPNRRQVGDQLMVGDGRMPFLLWLSDAQRQPDGGPPAVDTRGLALTWKQANQQWTRSMLEEIVSQCAPWAPVPKMPWQRQERFEWPKEHRGLVFLPLDEAFSRWLDYSGYSAVLLRLAEAEQLRNSAPERWRVLLAWVASGGNLLLFDCPEDWQASQSTIEALLRPGQNEPREAVALPSDVSAWQMPEPRSAGFRSRLAVDVDLQATDDDFELSWQHRPARPRRMNSTVEAKRWSEDARFRWRKWLNGRVVAWQRAEPFTSRPDDWPWLLNTLGEPRWSTARRHGVGYHALNRGFWALSVPGSLRVSPLGFQVLVGLFTLVVGPVNYVVLRWWRRLPWAVVTVPAIAAVFVAGLFGYALASEGVRTKVRPRSLTRLDQRTGEATCWARLAYYAPWTAPREFRFSTDTMVIPSGPVGGATIRGSGHEFVLRQDADAMVWQAGFLPSRTPMQYLTVNWRQTPRKLEIQEAASGVPRVVNALGARVERLWLCGSDGRMFVGEATEVEKVVPLSELPATSARQQMVEWLSAHELTVADDVDELLVGRELLPPGVQSWEIDGGAWGELEPLGMRLELSATDPCLTPRNYFVVLTGDADVELGRDDLRVVEPCHQILGQW